MQHSTIDKIESTATSKPIPSTERIFQAVRELRAMDQIATRDTVAALARAKKAYRHACAVSARSQGLGRVDAQKLHLSLTFFAPTRRAYDLDNALARMKAGLDGLADVMGVDDKHWSLNIQRLLTT